jgi:translation initiation factor IF-1
MICINQNLIRYYQKLPPNLLMDQLNYKDLFGKIMHAYSQLNHNQKVSLSSNYNLKKINAHISNFWHFINLKDSDKTLMEYWDYHLTKI